MRLSSLSSTRRTSFRSRSCVVPRAVDENADRPARFGRDSRSSQLALSRKFLTTIGSRRCKMMSYAGPASRGKRASRANGLDRCRNPLHDRTPLRVSRPRRADARGIDGTFAAGMARWTRGRGRDRPRFAPRSRCGHAAAIAHRGRRVASACKRRLGRLCATSRDGREAPAARRARHCCGASRRATSSSRLAKRRAAALALLLVVRVVEIGDRRAGDPLVLLDRLALWWRSA